METRSQTDEERANILEVQVDESRVVAEDADRKYEEVRWRVSACACACHHVPLVLLRFCPVSMFVCDDGPVS